MKLLDPQHPFFRNPWARWLTTLVPLAWAGVEIWLGNPAWAVLFGAAGLYAGWLLILRR